MKLGKTALCLGVLLLCPVATSAQNPVQALTATPANAFEWAFPGTPMTMGNVGNNRKSWQGIGEQHWAAIPVEAGAITANKALIDKYWPAFDVAFSHMRADGNFDYPVYNPNGTINDPRGVPTSNAFWLGDSAQALLFLRSSHLSSQYASKIDALVPKYRTALTWLARPENVTAMIDVDSIATNRLLFDAKAFLLGDKLANAPQARAQGYAILRRALANQSTQGYFAEHGGSDTSYNAVSCSNLAGIVMFVPDPRLRDSMVRCANWELSRLRPDGDVDTTGNTRTGANHVLKNGKIYGVSYTEVVRMFAFVWSITGDRRYMQAAQQVAAFRAAHP